MYWSEMLYQMRVRLIGTCHRTFSLTCLIGHLDPSTIGLEVVGIIEPTTPPYKWLRVYSSLLEPIPKVFLPQGIMLMRRYYKSTQKTTKQWAMSKYLSWSTMNTLGNYMQDRLIKLILIQINDKTYLLKKNKSRHNHDVSSPHHLSHCLGL
jgi:hypothetical protein